MHFTFKIANVKFFYENSETMFICFLLRDFCCCFFFEEICNINIDVTEINPLCPVFKIGIGLGPSQYSLLEKNVNRFVMLQKKWKNLFNDIFDKLFKTILNYF